MQHSPQPIRRVVSGELAGMGALGAEGMDWGALIGSVIRAGGEVGGSLITARGARDLAQQQPIQTLPVIANPTLVAAPVNNTPWIIGGVGIFGLLLIVVMKK